jgi:multidrug efflux pump subunit AcrA (membrane-fusion protein)
MPASPNVTLIVLSRIAVCAVLILIALGVSGWLVSTRPEAGDSGKGDQLRRVTVIEALEAPVGRRLRAYGTARALQSADVPARVSATVAELGERYREGERVAKAEILLRLDDTDFRRQMEIATQAIDGIEAQLALLTVDERTIEESLKLAEADAKIVHADVERAEQALREGAAKEREVDRVRQLSIVADRALLMAREGRDKLTPRRASLNAERARQEASKQLAQDSLDRCLIRSPIDGVLQSAEKEVGEMVAGGTQVARVVDPARLEVPILLPASTRSLVSIGNKVMLKPDRDGAVDVEASVTRISPEDDPTTRTFAVYAELSASPVISPGTFVEAAVLCPHEGNRTVLPRRSVSEGRILVFRDGRVHLTPVEVEFGLTGLKPQTGLPDSEWLVLRDALPSGSKVVLDASRQIPDGTAIAAEPPRAANAAASPVTTPSAVNGGGRPMRGLVHFGVKRPIVGSLLMWFLVIGGVYCLLNLRREFFPKVDPDAASILIVYPGASPAEIEESMARKIEDELSDLDGIKRITSNLAEGGGGIAVEFNDGRDMADALDDVRVAIDSLNDLPEEAERIRVTELQPNFPVIMLTLFGDASESALKQAARRVADELRSLPEMGSVVLTGTRDSEIRIDVDPMALQRHGLRLSAVNDIVRSWMAEVPGGTMRTAGANVGVRTMGVAERAETIRNIPIVATTDGQVVRLGDIATVTEDFVDQQVSRRFNGKPAASIIVFKKGEEDAVRIAEMVRGYVAGRRGDAYSAGSGWSALKSIVTGSDRKRGYELGDRMRQRDPLPCDLQTHSDLARIIEGRLDLLTNDAWQGSLLVFVVMVLFMNARSAWWVMSGIFVSIGCTVLLMWMFDITLNLITMFGLLIVVGMLADDAIVVSDIILQRAAKGGDADEAAIEGTTSVFWPIVANAATVIVAFLPLAFVGGRIGDLLAMLPMVAAAALGSSVIETMIILPSHMAHSIHSMRGRRPGPIARAWGRFEHWREDRLMPRITGFYTRVATSIVDNRYIATTATIAVLIISLGMVGGGRVPFTFLPADDSETAIIDIRMPIGSTIEMTRAMAAPLRGGGEEPKGSARGQFDSGPVDQLRDRPARRQREPRRPALRRALPGRESRSPFERRVSQHPRVRRRRE